MYFSRNEAWRAEWRISREIRWTGSPASTPHTRSDLRSKDDQFKMGECDAQDGRPRLGLAGLAGVRLTGIHREMQVQEGGLEFIPREI